jgi:transposase
MAAKQRPRYPKEFQERAVRLSQEAGKTVEEVASELGISASSLINWRQKLGVSRGRTGEHKLRSDIDSLQAQLKLAEKEKKALAMEVEILKKAAAFFARNQA